MGLNRRAIAFLSASRTLGVSFEQTLTIGRQNLWADERRIVAAFKESGFVITSSEAREIAVGGAGYAELLLRRLGATRIDSLDASDYEGSTITHDLNEPFPGHLRRRYSVVLDAGSLEHVFNFPEALRGCLSAVRVGGHFIAITPANNFFGHGFYQFSPELYHRVLSRANGFRVSCVLVRAERRLARWYAVTDPAAHGRRITLSGGFPSLLYVVGRRIDDGDALDVFPQQSDYAASWEEPVRPAAPRLRRLPGSPAPVRDAGDWLRLLANRPTTSGLRPVKLAELRLGDGDGDVVG